MGTLELAKALIETGSFHWESTPRFTLASGRRSEYYINCKGLLAYPEYRLTIAELISGHLDAWDLVGIGGMEIGAIPIATSVSDYMYARKGRELRTFVVRKKPKDHGMKHSVEGSLQAGDRVLVVDDVLTTGQATLDAIDQARTAGLDVKHALVIVDRQEDHGRERVEAAGVLLTSLLTLEDLKNLKGQPNP